MILLILAIANAASWLLVVLGRRPAPDWLTSRSGEVALLIISLLFVAFFAIALSTLV
jgi:hypothetical protein